MHLKLQKSLHCTEKGDRTNLNTYRPTSILLTISKVFERVIHIQLYKYLFKITYYVNNNTVSVQNILLHMLLLVDYLVRNMDENFTPCAIYLDLSKAFDTLNFDILTNKLKFYGIIGTPSQLLDKYLKNRHQFVAFKNINSDLQEIQTGIPQGSILGPLFFSIYINNYYHY